MSDAAPTLTIYERAALAEIEAFKNPHPSVVSRLADLAAFPLEKGASLLLDNAVGEAVTKAIGGIVGLVNDGASWTVRMSAVLNEFRGDGHGVESLAGIQELPLESVDKVVGYLGAKYKTLAAAEGAATGMGGAAGIAIDVPLLVAIALRAVNEFATYYGFDVSLEHERKFALSVLGVASSPTVVAKHRALAELAKLSTMLAKKATWAELEKLSFVELVKRIAESLGMRLTKQKLGQIVPVIGAVVGAGVNLWFVANVVDASYHLYRERFLLAKHGPDVAVDVRDQ